MTASRVTTNQLPPPGPINDSARDFPPTLPLYPGRWSSIEVSTIFNAPCCHIYAPVGEHAFLSNFAATPILMDGVIWPTAEHAYQGRKFTEPAIRELVRQAPSGDAAKAVAWDANHTDLVDKDWDNHRVEVMRQVLALKFGQSPSAANALVSTWPLPIIESSPTDYFWGVGASGDGENMLGLLLESQRRLLMPHQPLLELVHTPPGVGGRSCTRLAPSRWVGTSAVQGSMGDLAYDAFRRIDILQSLQDVQHEANTAKDEAHAHLLDEKYAGYDWTEDARSIIPNWTISFKGLISTQLRTGLSSARILVVGAGSANESDSLWADFGSSVTLVDWGEKLANNCLRAAPSALTLRRRAEDLHGVPDASHDAYISLRTFDSAFLDARKALQEAFRILRPGGVLGISISDGYLTKGGTIVRGQFGENGKIDRAASWLKLLQIIQETEQMGLMQLSFFDLTSEIGFFGIRP